MPVSVYLETSFSSACVTDRTDPAEHELVVRDRFYHAPRAARVVWLPVAREAITWFKPFELEAEAVWEAPRSRASRSVEETLFGLAVDGLDRMEQVDLLAKELDRHLQAYKDREKGFWGCQATDRIGWRFLVRLAGVANLLVENQGVVETWKSADAAVAWYGSRGWRLDSATTAMPRSVAGTNRPGTKRYRFWRQLALS